MFSRFAPILTAAFMGLAGPAMADVCQYKPSRIAGPTASVLASAAGQAIEAGKTYALAHATSGLTLLGASGTGSGTVGALTNGGGTLGAAGSALTAPVTLFVAGVTIIGAGVYEGACWFQVDRVTDPQTVRDIVENAALLDDAMQVVIVEEGDFLDLNGERFLIDKLYIADGVLRYRDWGPNTNLGRIFYNDGSDTTE